MKNKKMSLPRVGFGTWEITKKKEVYNSIQTAINCGYKNIDTAQIYNNEYYIGNILKKNSDKKLFITTKIWPVNYKYHALKSLDQSLKRLKLKKINLILLHASSTPENNLIAYKQMIIARKKGLVDYIGVSNFTIKDIKYIYKNTHEYPYANEIVVSPLHRMNKMEKFSKKNNIKMIGYSTIRPYYNPNVFISSKDRNHLKDNEKKVIDKIAKKHKVDPAVVLLRWSLQHDYYIIPKSVNPSRIKSNLKAVKIKLSKNEMKKIDKMNIFNDKEYTKALTNDWKPRTVSNEKTYKRGLLFKKTSLRIKLFRIKYKLRNKIKCWKLLKNKNKKHNTSRKINLKK